MQNVNTVVITGNLTRDPDLRYLQGGDEFLCKLRVAVSGRRKDSASGEWVDKPNYFDVAVWGGQAASCANYLVKGRGVAVAGRLDWHEWEDKEGARRESVEVVAGSVQFLGSPARESEAAREGVIV
jgi:single-strand DNA-binding protein